jgi:O-antigen/teichoic acid export membrane protein
MLVPGRPRFRFNSAVARELFAYGKFMTALAVVVFIGNQLDNAVIGKLLGMESLGYYSLAYTLANLPSTNLSKIVAKVLFPMFSKLQSDLPQLRHEYARGVRLLITVVVPMTCGIVVLADDIVLALYGAKWASSAMPLRILAVFGCLQALWMLNGYLFNAIGKPQVDFYANASRLVIVLALLYPSTVAFGIIGTSIAVTVPMACQFATGLYLSKRVIGVPVIDTLRPLSIALAQGAVLAAILWAAHSIVPTGSLMGLIGLAFIGLVVTLLFNRKDLLRQLSRSRSSLEPIRNTP